MRKSRKHGYEKPTLHFLVCLIAFGLIAIVGSGGGGGETTTTTTTGDTGGGDTGDQAGLTYTGSTSQAIIDSGNCLAFCVGAYDGGKTGSATRRSPAGTDSGEDTGLPRIVRLSQAMENSLRQIEILNRSGERFAKDVYTASDTLTGDCGGSASYSLTMTIYMRDNSTEEIFWVEDYSVSLTEVGNEIEFEMSGKFYDPDDGFISVSTTEPFIFSYYGYYPYEGVLEVTGAPGSAGGYTKARLTVLSSTTLRVEADTNGDGTYDYDSDVLNWSDV